MLKFKAYHFESIGKINGKDIEDILDAGDFEQFVPIFLKNKIKNNDSCEERFTKFLSVVSTYYSKRRTNFIDKYNEEHIVVSENVFIQFAQQFELCICKNEWKKINQESRLMYFFHSKNNNKNALDILSKNLERIAANQIQDVELTKDKKNNVIRPLSISDKSNHEHKKDDIYCEFVNHIWHGTVANNLVKILCMIDADKRITKESLETVSGKRYIYSFDSPIHPSGKDFVNPKIIELGDPQTKAFVETNFSVYQGHRVAERMLKVLKYPTNKMKNELSK